MATKAKTRTFVIGPDEISQEEMTRWIDVQVFHENLAGNKDIAERACKHVSDLIRWYESSTGEIRGLCCIGPTLVTSSQRPSRSTQPNGRSPTKAPLGM